MLLLAGIYGLNTYHVRIFLSMIGSGCELENPRLFQEEGSEVVDSDAKSIRTALSLAE
jgi:hypothetical protein